MSRPSQHTDLRLIAAGREVIHEKGCSGLNIREVSRRAGVNLGMFHYHFKTKTHFLQIVLQDAYEGFFKELTLGSQPHTDLLSEFRRVLLVFGHFGRDHRAMLHTLLRDIMNGNKEATQFAVKNFPRHIQFVAGLILKCQQAGVLARIPIPQAIAFTASGLNIPFIIVNVFETRLNAFRPTNAGPPFNLEDILSDEAIEQRVGLILKGLAP